MVFAGIHDLTLTKEQLAVRGLLAALRWENPREKDSDPVFLGPQTIIYLM
jgi:hypothetical protein